MSQTRRKARQIAVQALYQWHVTQINIAEIERQFKEEHADAKIDWDYFHELLFGVATALGDIDAQLLPLLDRGVEEISLVERGILRLGVFELMSRLDVPYRVVINEAIDMAKKFGTDQGHKFVNGILDKAARKLRAAEIGAGR